MTYKTLVRKSDGHWMQVTPMGLNKCSHPIPERNDFDALKMYYENIDWSLYALEEVYVIRKSEMPSDENIWKEINIRIPDEYYAQECGKIINKLKSQILKP